MSQGALSGGNRDGDAAWPTIVVIVAVGWVAAMQAGKVPPSLPAMRSDLALGLVAAGFAASAYNATSVALGLVSGPIADRLGHRRVFLTSIVCLAAGSLLGAFAWNGATIILTRLVEGLGFLGIAVTAPSLIFRVAGRARSRFALGFWSAYMPAGLTIMLLIAPFMLRISGWRFVWIANAAIAAAVLVIAALGTRRLPSLSGPPAPPIGRALRQALSLRGPWLLGACFGAYAFQWLAIVVWLPTFLIETHAYTTDKAAFLMALVIVANIPGNLAGGWLLQRNVPRWVLIAAASAVMAITEVIVFGSGAAPATVVSFAIVWSLFGGVLPAAIFAGVPMHAPSPAQVGAATGIVIVGINIGSLSGPPAFAAMIAATGGWADARWLLAGCGLIAVILSQVVRRIERRLDDVTA